mgnify:CR=1 FL=1|tara:strand:+ start:1259 stop:1753 length:495 start_codon:yes stop_codon:yes gene_type:complete
MYNPSTIANYFIKKYSSEGALTPMKLIKLVYISYAWYLTLTEGEKTLIDEKPQAWDYGPVFPSLYQSLKKFGKTEIQKTIPNQSLWEKIRDEDKPFLNKMWDMYGSYGGIYLSAITHTDNSPWDKAFKKGYNHNISDKDILEHYVPKLKPKTETNTKYNYTESN